MSTVGLTTLHSPYRRVTARANAKYRRVVALFGAVVTACLIAPTVAQTTCGALVDCPDERSLTEYLHTSGVYVYLACAADRAAVEAQPTLFTKKSTIAGGPITDPASARSLQRYFLNAKTGSNFVSRHFYTTLSAEEAIMDAMTTDAFTVCKEGKAGSFAVPQGVPIDANGPASAFARTYCATGQRPVWRLFLPSAKATAAMPMQHRFTDSQIARAALVTQGYDDEYVRLCVGDSTYTFATRLAPLSPTAIGPGQTASYQLTVTNPSNPGAPLPSGTVAMQWPAGLTLGGSLPPACVATRTTDTSFQCSFPTQSGISLPLSIALVAAANYQPHADSIIKAAATAQPAINNAPPTSGVTVSGELDACTANGMPAAGCSVLPLSAVLASGPTFTLDSPSVSGVATGVISVSANVTTTAPVAPFIPTAFIKLSGSSAWLNLMSTRTTLPAGTTTYQFLTAKALDASMRGQAVIRVCASAGGAVPDPSQVSAGPSNPACAESAVFVTPAINQAQSTFSLTAVTVGAAETGTINIGATITSTVAQVPYKRYTYFKGPHAPTWALIDTSDATSNAASQPHYLSYLVPDDQRGTAQARVCVGTQMPTDPDTPTSGPSDPACATSAPFTTPQANNQDPLALSITTPTVSGADTGSLTINASASANQAGKTFFAYLFFKSVAASDWGLPISPSRYNTSTGQTAIALPYSVPESARGASATVSVCVGVPPAPTSPNANSGPGNPACAESAPFTVPPLTPPINLQLTAPVGSRLGSPASWGFTASAAENAVPGPLYLDLVIPANWTFSGVELPAPTGALTCPQGATPRLYRCNLLAAGQNLPKTPELTGSVNLTPNPGAGGVPGTLVASITSAVSAPTAPFTCAANNTACQSSQSQPDFVDLEALQPSPPLTDLTTTTVALLTCKNNGTRPAPNDATCGVTIDYTDQTSDPPQAAPWPQNPVTSTHTIALCGATATPPQAGCAATLSAGKTVKRVTLRAKIGSAAAGPSEPDNNPGNNEVVVYDNTPPAAPTVSTSSLPVTANVGSPYSGTFNCSGSTRLQNFTCGLAAGSSLPAGLTMNTPCTDTASGSTRTITCTISGTPTGPAGSVTFTIEASSTNAVPNTATQQPVTMSITTQAACPNVPGAYMVQEADIRQPVTIQIVNFGTSGTRYIKLMPSPGWKTQADYAAGYADYLLSRIVNGWTGVIAISSCPGDTTSSNVVHTRTGSGYMYFYGLPPGAQPIPAPNPRGAAGLPGLNLTEDQGGKVWYINYRTDTCDEPTGCFDSYHLF